MRRRPRVWAAIGAAGLVVLAGCSASSGSSSAPSTRATSTQPTIALRPATGPAAIVSGPVTGGKGISLEGPTAQSLAPSGYTDSEFFVSGTASSYVAAGALGNDGHWSVKPSASATYRTRIVVRAPRDPKKFNGTVLVEWLNVSGGIDAGPDFSFLQTELVRGGYAWVGVSAQQIGVSGGVGVVAVRGVPTNGLRGIDPARYSSLHHPGDAYAYDIYSQVGRAIRSPGAVKPLGSLRPQRVLAIGESQSAFELTTYIDAFQPTTHVYDGFFVHSRGGGATPLAGGNITAGLAGGIKIRNDTDVPVLLLETETDEAFLHYFDARQPDSAHIRLWDVAGAAHADTFLVGDAAKVLGCKGAINSAPTHYVVSAALHALDRWVRTGTAPPSAPRMDVKLVAGSPVVQRDSLGVAIGGIRTAAINVPVAAYSGVAADSSSVLCILFGSTHAFDTATLTRLYPTKPAYLTAFTKATANAIAAGYVLAADRAAILAEAARVTL